jgi:superfamily II DNA or RNA helicase
MSDLITVEKYNDAYIKVLCEPGVGYELSEYFTFVVPGAKFMPQVKSKFWDGKIRLFNVATGLLYAGLIPYIRKFAYDREYTVDVDYELQDTDYSLKEAQEFCSASTTFEPRDYQVEAFAHAMRTRRALLLSPTASGKSLIIYMLAKKMIEAGRKILVIVPTTSLVYQMKTDFQEYGYDKNVRVIDGTQDKSWRNDIDEDIVVSTWQSIYKMPKPWFNQFKCVMGDEAHNFKSKSLTAIMTKLESCEYRYGFTGTLDGTMTHKLVLEGLFGATKKVTTSKELMDEGTLAELKIKCIQLGYPEATCKERKGQTYQEEMQFIVAHQGRLTFLQNLVMSLKGNTLVLYQLVEKHGKIIYNNLIEQQKAALFDRQIFFVSGEIKAQTREEIRGIVEGEKDAVIVASYGTFSTGINIKNLDNIVFASPSKSKIRVLQSVGRGLRRSDRKTEATLFDIADDLQYKAKVNYTLQHFAERVKYYNDEKFDYKIYQVKIND